VPRGATIRLAKLRSGGRCLCQRRKLRAFKTDGIKKFVEEIDNLFIEAIELSS
jgi:hypothetical protein